MANDSIQPYTGPQTIDLAEIVEFLVDLAPGALRGLRREQQGMASVVSELAAGVPALGVKAGISSDVYASFKKTHEIIVKIRAARLVVDKLAEVLLESEGYYEDQRESDITLIAAAVRASARRRDQSIRASFEKTLTYNAQVAMKGIKTRRKNAAEAEGEAEGEVEGEAEVKAEAQGEAKGDAPEKVPVKPGGAPPAKSTLYPEPNPPTSHYLDEITRLGSDLTEIAEGAFGQPQARDERPLDLADPSGLTIRPYQGGSPAREHCATKLPPKPSLPASELDRASATSATPRQR